MIVNYNKEPYISQCIESVINQSLQPIEIIIVDDGSTDNSGIISSRYAAAHPHVRYLTQENNGVSSARNKGLSYAQGEYVAF
ncbi:glycosyltransferase [Priestia megaterium]